MFVSGILRKVRLMVGGYGKGVAALVFGVAGMPLYPVKRHAVAFEGGIEPEPKVHVFLTLETLPFPSLQPSFVQGFHDIG